MNRRNLGGRGRERNGRQNSGWIKNGKWKSEDISDIKKPIYIHTYMQGYYCERRRRNVILKFFLRRTQTGTALQNPIFLASVKHLPTPFPRW
jgi:hypothetical protein